MSDIMSIVEHLPEVVNADPALVHRGRHLTTEFLLEIGTTSYWIAIAGGRIASVSRGRALMRSWDFAVRASEAAWLAHWQPSPEPGYHDLLAMTKSGAAVIEGDFHTVMAHLQYLKDVLAAPRRMMDEPWR